MLRRSVLFVFRDTATSEERSRLLRGLSYLGLECPTVNAGDYGDDITGGSKRLLDVPPWKRTPRFHARGEGPPSTYDVALHLDFEDEAALAAYEGHPARREITRLVASTTVGDVTARLDWRYEGVAPNRRGHFRHSAMHVWSDRVDPAVRARALEAVASLGDAGGVDAVAVGESASRRAADFDWILDLQFADEHSALAFLAGESYAEATKTIAKATKDEWTARVTHLMRGG
jgi:Stress responsive A/B Barrel Domain